MNKKDSKQTNSKKPEKGGKAQKPKPPTKPKQETDDVRRDQKLQAILLADSFTTTFRPVTLETPKVLLPLVNVPMIDYTLEFLTQNGIEEIIVFCGWFADKLEAYLKSSRWTTMVSIKCVSSNSCSSAGDALRELDGMNIIRSDPFILISGDVIANINLKKAIAFHQLKRKEDSTCIMTLALKKVQKCGGSRPLHDDLVVGMNKKTSQVVIFDDSMDSATIKIPVELMESVRDLSFNSDLLDCNVDICSPELLFQFSENFDYQDIRKDFIRNECTQGVGKNIYGYIIENEYAARVQDPRTYHSISRDIVTRWTYPLVADVPLLREFQYTQSKRYVYRDVSVKIARTANIVEEVVIGRGTTVGEHAVVSRTVIGERVAIGAQSRIVDSHIWKDAVIGENVSVENAIVCDKAEIGNGCVIPQGCIVSFGVRLQAGTVLRPYTRVMVNKDTSDSLEWSYELEAGGVESSDQFVKLCSMGTGEAWKKLLWMVAPIPTDAESDDEEDAHSAEQSFVKVLSDMVLGALHENHPVESVVMEIKGYKFSQNKSFGECLKGIVGGVFAYLCSESDWSNLSLPAFFNKLKALLKVGSLGRGLIKALTHDKADECEIVIAVEDFILGCEGTAKYPLRYFLQIFYEAGLLSENGIFFWAALRKEESEPARNQLFQDPKVQEFIEWLEGEESEDEEGSEDSEDSASNSD